MALQIETVIVFRMPLPLHWVMRSEEIVGRVAAVAFRLIGFLIEALICLDRVPGGEGQFTVAVTSATCASALQAGRLREIAFDSSYPIVRAEAANQLSKVAETRIHAIQEAPGLTCKFYSPVLTLERTDEGVSSKHDWLIRTSSLPELFPLGYID